VKVLVAPDLDLRPGGPTAALAVWLAGEDGMVVSLAEAGMTPWAGRVLSQAEIVVLREALSSGPAGGRDGADEATPPATTGDGPIVGYICGGTVFEGGTFDEIGIPAGVAVAVTDHVGLTWGSPLHGPNDDSIGPRFPRVDAVYVPHVIIERGKDRGEHPPDVTIIPAVVAGTRSDDALSEWEDTMVGELGVSVLSPALVPVAIIAAHMGLRMAAVVMV
jgi:hypothetical protein